MAITPTLRFLLKQYGSGGDPHPNRAEFNAMIDAIENNAAMFSQGATDARPAAGKRGRFYYDETVDRLFYDNGTGWKDANPNGGGGAGRALAIGAAGTEGTSSRAARADHTHPLPLATNAAPGALAAADKAKLDAATDAAAPGALALRDASGRISVGTPTAGAHAATKTYVDGQAVELANYVDSRTPFQHMEFTKTFNVANNTLTGVTMPQLDDTTAVNPSANISFPLENVLRLLAAGVYSISVNFSFNGGLSKSTTVLVKDRDLASVNVWASAPIRDGALEGTLSASNFSVADNREYRIYCIQQSGGTQNWTVRVKVTRIH